MKATPDVRTPLYKGQYKGYFTESQNALFSTNQPLKYFRSPMVATIDRVPCTIHMQVVLRAIISKIVDVANTMTFDPTMRIQ